MKAITGGCNGDVWFCCVILLCIDVVSSVCWVMDRVGERDVDNNCSANIIKVILNRLDVGGKASMEYKCTRKIRKDITGMRSGRVVVIGPTDVKRENGAYLWHCRCDCGKDLLVEAAKITGGRIKSCGCARGEGIAKDLTGQRFGKLVALERLDRKRGNTYLWKCQCDCGNTTEVTASMLLTGRTYSCGCARVEAIKKTLEKHGTVNERVHLVDGTCVEKLTIGRTRKDNSSGYTGVRKSGNKWVAVITFKKKLHYLGTFDNIEDAIAARKEAENKFFKPILEVYLSDKAEGEESVKTEIEMSENQENSTK